MRRLILCLMLLAVGCRAQTPDNAALNRSIERQVRATFNISPVIDVAILGRVPSQEFVGFDKITVQLSYEGHSQTQELLLSRDGKTLYSLVKIDLTKDALAERMAKIDLTGRPVRGNPHAALTVVVYDDFQCPYCSRMHQEMLELLKTYGDRIRVIYKDFPLVEIHPWAARAAIDSNCLAQQNGEAFWDFADYVHAHGDEIRGDKRPLNEQQADVDRIALDAGRRHNAKMDTLQRCVQAQSTTAMKASMKEASELGIEATPTIFIDGMKLDGAVPQETLRAVIDKELATLGQPTKSAAGTRE